MRLRKEQKSDGGEKERKEPETEWAGMTDWVEAAEKGTTK